MLSLLLDDMHPFLSLVHRYNICIKSYTHFANTRCTDLDAQADSMDSLWYGHKYGLVDDDIFDLLWNHCDIRLPNLMARGGGIHRVRHQLNNQLKQIEDLDIRRSRAQQLFHEVILNGIHQTLAEKKKKEKTASFSPEEDCTLAFRKFLLSTSQGLSQGWNHLYIDDYSLFAPWSSLEDEQMAAYMMRPDVRKALHVEESPTTTWPDADIGFDYTSEYRACNWGDEIVLNISMVDIYKEVVPQLERTWIYNGDTDPCVSYEGTRLAVKQIGLEELDGGSYRPWFYNQTGASMKVLMEKSALFGPNLVAQDMGAQFAGEVTDYEQGLAFVTFHGSGHMVRSLGFLILRRFFLFVRIHIRSSLLSFRPSLLKGTSISSTSCIGIL